MIITTFKCPLVTFTDKNTGVKKTLALKLGRHNYSNMDPKTDSLLAKQLQTLEKHGFIGLNGNQPKSMLAPSPVGRKVKGTPKSKSASNDA